MKGVIVKGGTLESGRKDTNAVYVWAEDIENRGVRIFYRKAGEAAGSEYHTGKDPSKNPERFFIAYGRMVFTVCDGSEVKKINVRQGQEIEIYPKIWHGTYTPTDVIYLKVIQPVKKTNQNIRDTVDLTLEEFKHRFLKREL